MRVGVTTWQRDGDRLALLTQARLAERAGYDSFFVPESHFVEQQVSPDPLLELAAASAVTERLRLGTTSFLLTIRHPLLVAEQVALLDQLSRGRLILGLGRGFRRATFDAFGIERETKRERLAASLELVRRAWRGESIAGPEATGGKVKVYPRPFQRPHPPLWMAAFGPRALAQAGTLALPYLASPLESCEHLEQNYARHRDAWTGPEGEAGRVVPVMRTVHLAHDRAEAERVEASLMRERETLRSRTPGFAALGDAPIESWALVGDARALTERVTELRERLGITHLIVRPPAAGLDPKEVERSVVALPEVLAGTGL